MRDRQPPEHLAVRKFVLSKGEIYGVWPLARFERLLPQLHNSDGAVDCGFRGEVDAVGRPFLHVQVQTQLQQTCQTCMQAMMVSVDTQFSLQLVRDESQIDEDADYDPLLVGDEDISLRDIVEDELILSLPVVANHEPGECKVNAAILQQNDIIEEEPQNNPFSALASLKKT